MKKYRVEMHFTRKNSKGEDEESYRWHEGYFETYQIAEEQIISQFKKNEPSLIEITKVAVQEII